MGLSVYPPFFINYRIINSLHSPEKARFHQTRAHPLSSLVVILESQLPHLWDVILQPAAQPAFSQLSSSCISEIRLPIFNFSRFCFTGYLHLAISSPCSLSPQRPKVHHLIFIGFQFCPFEIGNWDTNVSFQFQDPLMHFAICSSMRGPSIVSIRSNRAHHSLTNWHPNV